MNFDPGWIFFMLITSGLGFIYFQYGRKNARFSFIVFGLALMFCAYFAHTALALGITGLILAAGPFIYKKLQR